MSRECCKCVSARFYPSASVRNCPASVAKAQRFVSASFYPPASVRNWPASVAKPQKCVSASFYTSASVTNWPASVAKPQKYVSASYKLARECCKASFENFGVPRAGKLLAFVREGWRWFLQKKKCRAEAPEIYPSG